MTDAAQPWPLAAAWEAAVQVTAATFRVDPAAITAESRGRGPRPPEAVREPKKLALYIAVTLAGCDYAALARHVKLHKDTVTSHCAEIRDRCAREDRTERVVEALGSTALVWLEVSKSPGSVALHRLKELETFIVGVISEARKSRTDEGLRLIRPIIRPENIFDEEAA